MEISSGRILTGDQARRNVFMLDRLLMGDIMQLDGLNRLMGRLPVFMA